MESLLVSVPFRGSCSEILTQQSYKHKTVNLFPSPFGVRVLKSYLLMHIEKLFGAFPSFRGSCSETAALISISLARSISVPFRGSCSEMRLYSANPSFTDTFPSPFGVRVLKFKVSPEEMAAIKDAFPSPFGVRVLK